jgi:hypothetical protein
MIDHVLVALDALLEDAPQKAPQAGLLLLFGYYNYAEDSPPSCTRTEFGGYPEVNTTWTELPDTPGVGTDESATITRALCWPTWLVMTRTYFAGGPMALTPSHTATSTKHDNREDRPPPNMRMWTNTVLR